VEDAVTRQTVAELSLSGRTKPNLGWSPGAALSPDGRTLAVCEDSRGRILLFEMRTGRLRGAFNPSGGYLSGLLFLPGGGLLWGGDTALVWPVALRPSEAPKADELAGLWAALADPDPEKSWPAMAKLAAAPREAVGLVRKQVRAVPRLSDAA